MKAHHTYTNLIKELHRHKSKARQESARRFFKTGKGEYSEHDVWIGVSVPDIRKIARSYSHLSYVECSTLLSSSVHEERLLALFMLVRMYQKSDTQEKEDIVRLYLSHTKHINNWDLVDSSAYQIIGEYVRENKKSALLKKLAKSKNLWERRIAIVATFSYIKNGIDTPTQEISTMLLSDTEDLIHKAVGWMLREAGKRVSEKQLCEFLDLYNHRMPRTMLRYAIERLPERKRLYYMNK